MNGGDEVVAAPVGSSQPPLEWKFSQVFGERTAGEEVQEGIIFLVICENYHLCFYLDPIDILWKVLGLGFVLGLWIRFGLWVVEKF